MMSTKANHRRPSSYHQVSHHCECCRAAASYPIGKASLGMRSSSRAHIPVSESSPLARLMSDTYKQINVSGKLYFACSMGELLKEGDKANRMPVALDVPIRCI
jgi:hypothetical protein